jgi:hypothetical protein
LIVGIISAVAGAIVLSQPLASALLTTTLLLYFLAFAAIFSGVASVVTGFRLRKTVGSERSMIAGGLLHVAFGVLILSRTMFTLKIFTLALGFLAILGGVVLVFLALQMRTLGSNDAAG